MSAERTSALLLRLYPADWRRRYGDELDALIVESSTDDVPWRVRFDVAAAATREHARIFFGQGGDAHGRARSGLLAVLWGWLLVVIGGVTIAKTSEHWQSAVPLAHQHGAAAAFDALQAAAIVGTVTVLVGAGLCLPAVTRRIARRDLAHLRRPAAIAALLTVTLVAAGAAIAGWAHSLTAGQRNGHDPAYTAAFLATGALAIGCLTAWTFLAARLARELALTSSLLRVQTWLATVAAASMLTIVAATIFWWSQVADFAPHFLGSGGAPPKLIAAGAMTLAGALLAATGARHALRTLPALDATPRP
jgi:hypothetical protein